MATGVAPSSDYRCGDDRVDEGHQQQSPVRPPRVIRQTHRGGYECEFMERPPKAVQCDCPICLLILREPHQVTCCGYNFCATCVKRVREDKTCCPTCKEAEFNVFPNKGLRRTLNEYCIFCCKRSEGCEWVGELGEFDRHLNLQPPPEKLFVGCQFSEVHCTYCFKPFQRRQVQAHQSDDCPRRPYTCHHCNKFAATLEDVTQRHWPVCPFFPLSCPNNCGLMLQRQEVEHHVSQDCPLTVVKCDFHNVGCHVKLARRDLPPHTSGNLVGHMSLLQVHMATHPGESMATYMVLMMGSIQSIVLDNANICSELHEAQEMLQETSDKLQQSRDQLQVALYELQVTRDELRRSQGTTAQLNKKVAGHIEMIATHTEELHKAQDRTARLETSSGIQQEQHKNLQQEMDEFRKENRTLRQQKADLLERITANEEKTQVLETKLAALHDEKKKFHQKVEELSTKLEQLNTTLLHRELQERASTQLQSTITAQKKDTTANQHALDQHKRESNEEVRAIREEISKKLTASEQRMQKKLSMQLAQQRSELTERLSASEQKIQSQVAMLTKTSTQVQAAFTAHKKETSVTLDQQRGTELRENEELSKMLSASERRMQKTINTMLTQQKHELTKELLASEQKVLAQVSALPQASTDLQGTTTAHRKKSNVVQCTLDQNKERSTEMSRATKGDFSNKEREEERKQPKKEARLRDDLTHEISASEQSNQLKEAAFNQHHRTLEKVMGTGKPLSEFTMTGFEKHKEAGDDWYSPPFYTHTDGYRMCVKIHARGNASGKGTHVSVYTCIMHGPFDSAMKWPLRGDVTIQILNQAGGDNHREMIITYTDHAPDRCAGRVTDGKRSDGWGYSQFLPHRSLGYNAVKNTHYLQGDSLQIRVSKFQLNN